MTAATLIADDKLERLREQLPATQQIAYFNAGTLGPWPRSTHAAMRDLLDRELIERQPSDLWTRLDEVRAAARAAVARLCGVDATCVALQHATHPGINAALWGLDLRPGDVIVTTSEEHPGVTVPLRIVTDRLGVEVVTLDFPATADSISQLIEAVPDACRAVVISHVSWLTGEICDLESLHTGLPSSCRLIVDGAQGAGALDIRSAVAASDAYTISGQKWTLGPNGTGALVLADPASWSPTFAGFFAVEDPGAVATSPYTTTGQRFEVGQEAMTPLAGLTSSIEFLTSHVGLEVAQSHSHALNLQLRSLLEPTGLQLRGPAHLLCIRLPGRAAETARGLLERGFLTREIGSDILRVSLGFWNTHAEVVALANALAALDVG